MRRCLLRGIAVLFVSSVSGCQNGSLPPPPPPRSGYEPAPKAAPGAASVAVRNKMSAETAQALEKADRDRYWLSARESGDKQALDLLAQHQSELKKGIFHDKLLRGDPQRKWVALTFDDGPHPDYTPAILKLLNQYEVKATFFLVGEMAEKHPDLVLAEASAGHSIGNHTYHHVSLLKVPEDFVVTEIKACGEVLEGITGKAPRLFRPPGGDYNTPIAEAVEALGYKLILWTDDPGDYASPGKEVILKRTLSNVENGAIILVHDGIQQTVDALPTLLRYLKDEGYELVTIDQMLAGGAKGSPSRAAGKRVPR